MSRATLQQLSRNATELIMFFSILSRPLLYKTFTPVRIHLNMEMDGRASEWAEVCILSGVKRVKEITVFDFY